MIEALYEFGKLRAGKTPKIPLEKIDADYLLILDVDREGRFKGIELTKNISKIEDKLLHKRMFGGRNPPNFTPTLRLGEITKSLSNIDKILKNLRRFRTSIFLLQDLNDLNEIADKIKEELIKDGLLKVGKRQLSSKQKVFITLRVNKKFIGEIPEFKEAFENFYLSKLGKLNKGTCSLCGRETLVSGRRSPLTFYTLDKIGYLSGFSQKYHLRGFPLCFNCFKIIDFAKIEIRKHPFMLCKGFFTGETITDKSGKKKKRLAFIIPTPLVVRNVNEVQEVFENIFDLEYLKKYLQLTKEEFQRLCDVDEDILDLLKELKDVLTFHFIFIEESNSQELIRLHIQDVYPSRIRKLFKAKSYVERSLNLKEFTFKTVGQFFWKWDKESKNKDLQKSFLELLDRIFRKVPYSETLLIKFLLNGIRQAYKEELEGKSEMIPRKSLEALASFLFVKATTEGVMSEIKTDDVKRLIETLPLLKSSEAKGLFLLGVLTQRLLDKQDESRQGSKPFLKKLSGFKLNERGFKKLTPELREKMEAYGIFGKLERELFDLASEYFAQSNERWKLSLEEMNFIFAVGMGMKSKVYEGGNRNGKSGIQ